MKTPNALQRLTYLLNQPHLTPEEVLEGITACFTLTMEHFVRRRRPNATEEMVRDLTQSLLAPVFEHLGLVAHQQPTPAELAAACHEAEERLAFASEPDLLEKHRAIISRLLQKMHK